MEHIGIDVHKKESQVCILVGDSVSEFRIKTCRERFGEIFGGRERARILIEASTESEWVARCLEELGHEVIVADPNFALMYATRSKKVKTDRRDARALADACRTGNFRRAHRASEQSRQLKAEIAVREVLVQSRTRFIAVARAVLRRDGSRVRSGDSSTFRKRVEELDLSSPTAAELAPLLAALDAVSEQIEACDEKLCRFAETNAATQRLMSVPGVGPVVATNFVAVVDDPTRFHDAHHVESYLGVVPREMSSGEKQRKGPITKMGNRRMRCLLVQAAWNVMLRDKLENAPLREWAKRIAARRGTNVAIVALARKLAGILYAVWKTKTDYDPNRLRPATPIAA